MYKRQLTKRIFKIKTGNWTGEAAIKSRCTGQRYLFVIFCCFFSIGRFIFWKKWREKILNCWPSFRGYLHRLTLTFTHTQADTYRWKKKENNKSETTTITRQDLIFLKMGGKKEVVACRSQRLWSYNTEIWRNNQGYKNHNDEKWRL